MVKASLKKISAFRFVMCNIPLQLLLSLFYLPLIIPLATIHCVYLRVCKLKSPVLTQWEKPSTEINKRQFQQILRLLKFINILDNYIWILVTFPFSYFNLNPSKFIIYKSICVFNLINSLMRITVNEHFGASEKGRLENQRKQHKTD